MTAPTTIGSTSVRGDYRPARSGWSADDERRVAAELDAKAKAEEERSAEERDAEIKARNRPRAVSLDKVKPEPIRWLWRGYIQEGILLALSGEMGQGKSSILLDLAARITTGRQWPDGSQMGQPSDVLVVCAEDGIQTVLRRMTAAGGDLSRCHVLPMVYGEPGAERVVTLPNDLPVLEEEIKEHSTRFIIIDPIESIMSGTDTHKGGPVRETLTRLAAIAGRRQATIAYLGHPAKAATSAGNAFGGSKAFVNAARAVYVVGPELGETGRYVMAPTKISEGRKLSGLVYSIMSSVAGDDQAPPIIEWHGPTSQTADETVCRPLELERGPTAEDRAAAAIMEILRKGPIRAKDLEDKGKAAANVGGDNFKRARAVLCEEKVIESYREGYPSVTWWKLTPGEDHTTTLHQSGKNEKSPRVEWCSSVVPPESDPPDDWPDPPEPGFRADGPAMRRSLL